MPEKKCRDIEVTREWCKGCGICVHFCKKGVLGLDDDAKAYVTRLSECNCCGECEELCPDLAIELIRE